MRRFIAFIVLALSLLGIAVFNLQPNAEKINWSQEFGGGTEVVYHVENVDDETKIKIDDVADTIANRLEEAGATSHDIDYAVDEGNRYEIKITLGARYQEDIDNILRSTVAAGKLSLYTSDSVNGKEEPFKRGTAEVLYDDNKQAYVKVEVNEELTEITDKANEDDKLLVLWQNKTDDMVYDELSKDDYTADGKTNKQLQENVLAVINLGDTTTGEGENPEQTVLDNSKFLHDEDEGKYYITFDSFGYASGSESSTKMNAQSAHSFVRMLNDDLLDYKITEVYRTKIDASYGDNASLMMMVSIIVIFVVVSVYLLISYGLTAISGIIGISLTILVDLLLMNLFNVQVGPTLILAVLISLLMATSMLIQYYRRTKEDALSGRAILKASNEGFRKTIATAVDSTILLVVLGIVLAVIAKESVKAYSIFLLISSALSILFVFLLGKFLNNYLYNSNVSTSLKLFNINPKNVQDLNGIAEEEVKDTPVQKFDTTRHGKKTLIATIAGIVIAIASVVTFAFVDNSFNYSNEAVTGRIEVRTIVDDLFEDNNNRATDNFKNLIISFDENIEVTNVWAIPDQVNPKDKDENYTYFYADLKTPLAVDSDAFIKLEEHIKTLDTSEDLMITTYEIHPGYARGEFANALIIVLVAVGIGLVYFLIRYRYTFSLASIVSVIAGTGISLGLISLTRLEVSAAVGMGTLTGLIMTLLLLIPFGNLLRQFKNESKVKVTTYEQREEISKNAWKHYVNEYVTLAVGFIVLLLILIPLSSFEMLPIYASAIISLLINAGLAFFMVLPLHLWLEKHLKFSKLRARRAEIKKQKREQLIKQNRNKGSEPEEIIIPGIND